MGLTVSRTPDERIVIGKDIVITVVEIRGNKVRIDVAAPRDVPVVRDELLTEEQMSEVITAANRPVRK